MGSGEQCPRCRRVARLRVTARRRQVRGRDGKNVAVEYRSSHCPLCGAFVRCEEVGVGTAVRRG